MLTMGIIGLGAIGQRMINSMNGLEKGLIEVTTVCDVKEELAEQTTKQLGGIPYFTNYKELLKVSEVDIVYVAVDVYM